MYVCVRVHAHIYVHLYIDDTPEVCTEKEPKVEVKKFWKRPIPGMVCLSQWLPW